MVGREHRFVRWFAIVSVAALLAATIWVATQLRAGASAADAATLLSLPLAVLAGVMAVPSFREQLQTSAQPDEGLAAAQAAATVLALDIAQGGVEHLQRLVGARQERINLRYTLVESNDPSAAAAVATEGRLFEDALTSGVPGIADYYRGTRPARLMVTGSPGGGKSVLAQMLILELITGRPESHPVPVRLSMVEWDLQVSPTLADFLVHHLVHTLDQPHRRAQLLVRYGMVLPVLDGLDEMDPTLTRDGHLVHDAAGNPAPDPHAPRARAALDLLNAYQDGHNLLVPGPLILTCRGAHYDALPASDRLRTAAHIRLSHIRSDDAVAYLERHAAGDDRWLPLLEHLRREPDGTLAQTLSTPWRLTLAATVYRHQGNPVDLLAHATAAALDEHLLARLIPSVTALPSNTAHYTSDQVHAWLHHLTRATLSPSGNPNGTELVLHHLWRLAGERAVRVTDFLVTTSTMLLLTLPVTYVGARRPLAAVAIVAGFVLLAGASAGRGTVRAPRRLRWKNLGNPLGRRIAAANFVQGWAYWFERVINLPYRLARRFLPWIALGGAVVAVLVVDLRIVELPAWVPSYMDPGDFVDPNQPRIMKLAQPIFFEALLCATAGTLYLLLPAVLVALPIALLGGLVTALTDSPSVADSPAKIIRSDLAVGAAVGIGGICLWPTGFVFIGPILALTVGTDAGRRYLIFLLCSWRKRELPATLATFLDWACEVRLLNLSGNAYHFRHRELHLWLIRHATPPPH